MFNSKLAFAAALIVTFFVLTFGWVSAAHAADVVFTADTVEPVRVKRPVKHDMWETCFRKVLNNGKPGETVGVCVKRGVKVGQ